LVGPGRTRPGSTTQDVATNPVRQPDLEEARATSFPQLHARLSVEPTPLRSPAVRRASGLRRCYGEGDTNINALRNVSLEIEEPAPEDEALVRQLGAHQFVARTEQLGAAVRHVRAASV
jgi:hypothetical protein